MILIVFFLKKNFEIIFSIRLNNAKKTPHHILIGLFIYILGLKNVWVLRKL